jgi:glycosyltransferase involved in cell wall biosynthesis
MQPAHSYPSEDQTPLVSVVVCSYNAERFMESTMRSVIEQTYGHMEILVLDNASEDGTVGILRRIGEEEPRLKLFLSPDNLGAYGGLNFLLDRAQGKYIAVQDHDDIWLPDKIARQVEFLENNIHYVGCGTAIVNYYEKYRVFLLRRQPRNCMVAWHSSLVFLNGRERYNSKLKIGNDFDFMKNALCRNNKLIYNLSEPHVLRRIGAERTNLSSAWINFRNIRDILSVKLSLGSKIPILCRLVIPKTFFEQVLLKLVLRRNLLSEKTVREIGFPTGDFLWDGGLHTPA